MVGRGTGASAAGGAGTRRRFTDAGSSSSLSAVRSISIDCAAAIAWTTRTRYYSLPGESVSEFPADQIDAWLKVVLDHLGARSPDGEVWSARSLRIGAASAMDAAGGVSLRRICWMGGWAAQSAAVKDYIDPPSSDAGRRYFGWLLPK
jgi:hypothetical protein